MTVTYMTFGKYRGQEISEIPYEYLVWAQKYTKNLYLRTAIEHRILELESEWLKCEELSDLIWERNNPFLGSID